MEKIIEKIKVVLGVVKDRVVNNFLNKKDRYLVFFTFTFITIFMYWFRIGSIFTHYTMSDVDIDVAIWQYSMDFFKYATIPNMDTNNLVSYPLGYDYSSAPVFSSVYLLMYWIYKIFGSSSESLMFAMNAGTLINYPLCGLFSYLFINKFTKNKYTAFLGSVIFTFSFHNYLYARSSLSFNHLWVIPLYLLTFVNYLSTPNTRKLILSGLALSLSFSIFPYWAFYSVLISPFIYFAFNKNVINIFKLFKYYVLVGCIMFLLNMNFIISTLHLINTQSNVDSGRGFNPIDQVTCLLCMFSTRYNVPTSEWFIQHGVWMGYVGLISGIVGLLYIKNKKYLVLFSGFIFSVLLASYVPGLFWINEIYFKFFHMFKSVSRMNIFASLFLVIMSGIAIAFIFKKYNLEKKYQLVVVFILVSVTLWDAKNQDPTFYARTDYTKMVSLYTPIRDNKNIQVIAGYPMEVSGLVSKEYGVTPMYELIGQSVHKKKLAGGADPHNPNSLRHINEIRNIYSTGTIEKLEWWGIDTIAIYNNLLTNATSVRETLDQDQRLEYVGRYIEGIDDKSYVSWQHFSRDISVYQIKSVKEKIISGEYAEHYKYLDEYKLSTETPKKFYYGLLISSLTLFTLITLLVRGWWRGGGKKEVEKSVSPQRVSIGA